MSILVEFFLSIDQELSSEDSPIHFTPNSGQKSLLQDGIATVYRNDYPVELPEGGFVVNHHDHPDLKYYCGQTNLIVKISDNKNVISIDPDMRNNIYIQPVFVICNDFFSIKQFHIQLLPPQDKLYGGVDQRVWLQATLGKYGDIIEQTPDGRTNLFLKIYVSPDAVLDVGKDAEVRIVALSDSIKNRVYGAIETELVLDGEITIRIPYSACMAQFMFVSISPGVHVTDIDMSMENNIKHQNISNIIGCAVDAVDIIAESFTISQTDIAHELSFELGVVIEISGDTMLDLSTNEAISLQFFLSADNVYDVEDKSLEYDGQEQVN